MEAHLDIKLSYACNNNCIHCVIADQREKARSLRRPEQRTVTEVVRELRRAASEGVSVVTFTGGSQLFTRTCPSWCAPPVRLDFGWESRPTGGR